MRVCVTGATGFIGSHVAHHLLDAGHELVALVRSATKTPSLSRHERATRVVAPLADRDAMARAVEGCDACVHVALGWGDRAPEMLAADTAATVHLLDACAAAGVEHFLYTSSTAALGPFRARMDESTPAAPDNFYGATKAASEAYVLAMGAQSKMRCNVIRPGYTFGNPVQPGAPTQPDRRFHRIAKDAAAGRAIAVPAGDGTQFIAAQDLARLYRAVLEADCNREVFFGLGSAFVSWEAIAAEAAQLAGSGSQVRVEGAPATRCWFDLSKIRDFFGFDFEPSTAITEHLRYLLQAPQTGGEA